VRQNRQERFATMIETVGLRVRDEGTKTLVSRGNLDMSWGTLVP
jgi:hypothetical protein